MSQLDKALGQISRTGTVPGQLTEEALHEMPIGEVKKIGEITDVNVLKSISDYDGTIKNLQVAWHTSPPDTQARNVNHINKNLARKVYIMKSNGSNFKARVRAHDHLTAPPGWACMAHDPPCMGCDPPCMALDAAPASLFSPM